MKTTTRHAETDAAVVCDPVAMSDEALVAAHRDEPNGPFLGVLVNRYEKELYGYLRRFLGDASLAEDAFQAAFLQVHLKSDLFDEGRRFRPWLYTVATNRAIDIQRRNRRHNLVSLDRPNQSDHAEVGSLLDLLKSDDANPSERFDLRERMEWVRQAVATLPEQLQSAVSLVYFRGMKYREAAAELAVPVGTVKSRLHSAISRLGEAWDEGNGARPGQPR
ncbi:RNA polymerase sigma factor [Pirellulimonas nuda]|uniref:RNA polymerase sigma factor n=1 Tax=Pirellulimonas nuda TaxID=2528009 RepID=UPI001E502402|nr:sigma-70 family RNA polymerase sigma factor [Pirellulimonas nuda]